MAKTTWTANAPLDATSQVYDSSTVIYDSTTVLYDGISPTLESPAKTTWTAVVP